MTTRSFIIVLAAAAGLAGCSGTQNRGLESVHQPVVARSDFVFDVPTSGGRLAPVEQARLAGWMDGLNVGYGDRVALDDPYPAAGVREDVAAVTARRGLLLADAAPVTGAPMTPGTVRVVVSRTTASVPGCPDHSRMNEPTWEAHTNSNYGCATNTNLAAMIANPADLVRGQASDGVGDPITATRAIVEHRALKPTGEGGDWLKSKAEKGNDK